MKQRAILFFFIGIMTGILQAQTLTLKDAGQLFLKQNLSLIAARNNTLYFYHFYIV